MQIERHEPLPLAEVERLCQVVTENPELMMSSDANRAAICLAMLRDQMAANSGSSFLDASSRWNRNSFGSVVAPSANKHLASIPLGDPELRARFVQVGRISARKADRFALIAMPVREKRPFYFDEASGCGLFHPEGRVAPTYNPEDLPHDNDAQDSGDFEVCLLGDPRLPGGNDPATQMRYLYMAKSYIDGLTIGYGAARDVRTPIYLPPKKASVDLSFEKITNDPTGSAVVLFNRNPVGYVSMWRIDGIGNFKAHDWPDGNPLSHITFSPDPGTYLGYISSARILPLFGDRDRCDLTQPLIDGIEKILCAYHARGIIFDTVVVRAHSSMVVRACSRLRTADSPRNLERKGASGLIQLTLNPWSIQFGYLPSVRALPGYADPDKDDGPTMERAR